MIKLAPASIPMGCPLPKIRCTASHKMSPMFRWNGCPYPQYRCTAAVLQHPVKNVLEDTIASS